MKTSQGGSLSRRNLTLTRSSSPGRSATAENGGGAGDSSSHHLKCATASRSTRLTEEQTVKRLRLSKALIVPEGTTVKKGCRRMAARKVAALLVTDSNGLLCGILTAKDIATRVIAQEINLEETPVSKVMTRNPFFVSYHTLAVVALQKMVQGEFRHLPVIKNHEVVALLDIADCLYVAIARMERTSEKGKAIVAAIEGVDKHWGSPLSGLNTFIETFRERMFKPTLSTIISENSKIATVDPSDTVLVAAKKMLEIRASSAVVTLDNKARGILTSKDMFTRVIAQDLRPESTLVEKVMTPNPECATFDTLIVDALHTMHDGKFLHLPVIDKDGMVVSLIDMFHLTRAVVARMSQEGSSLRRSMMWTISSSPSRKAVSEKGGSGVGNSSSYHRRTMELTPGRKVRRLWMSKCFIVPESTSINVACHRMAIRGIDALLVTNSDELLCGILTDKDIAARVIAHEVNLEKTPVSKVMTMNPQFVHFNTLVVEALQGMVQGKFRHLPVIRNGEVIGLLGIERCLHYALSYMEKTMKGKAIVNDVGSFEKHRRKSVSGPNKFIETLREPIFRLSLSSIISEKSKIVTVDSSDTVLVAAKKMLDIRASSVIVTVENKTQGILTSKDLLMRVIAQDLPPESTLIEKVMTPNPECATVDTPVIDALFTICNGKLLHLPVIDKDGIIVAVFDVLHLIHAVLTTLSQEESSLRRSVISTSSWSPSRKSAVDNVGVGVGNSSSHGDKCESVSDSMGLTGQQTVKQLRLSKALIVSETNSCNEACRRMTARRVDALLLADSNAELCGIVTAEDIAVRVIAREISLEKTHVSKVMTRIPVFVHSDTPVLECLQTVVQGKCRYLPVVENGEVISLFDVTKCLYDAIACMERVPGKRKATAATVEGVEEQEGSVSGPDTFIEMIPDTILGLTVSTIIPEKSKFIRVHPGDTVLVAAKKMLRVRASSAVVTVQNKLQGILTSKDMLMKVIAQDLPESTPVEKVMTPNPECATFDTPVIDALYAMHDGKLSHLPVVDEDGFVKAVLDVHHFIRAVVTTMMLK